MTNSTNNKESFFELLVLCTTRLICVAALVWFGLIVSNAVGSMKRSAKFAATEINDAVNVPRLLMPAAGHWSFAETELAVEHARCSPQELTRRVNSLYSMQGASNDSNRDDSNRDATELVALAKMNGATRTNCEAGSAWVIEGPQLQLCLITSKSTTPQIIAAAFAVRSDQQWQLTIVKPQPQLDDHLLPMPADSATTETKTACVRRSESGELQMELISTSLSAKQILDHWRDCGWNIRRTPWGTANSFSYLCDCGDEMVYAWSESSTGSRTLMLTSASGETVADSTPKPSIKTQSEFKLTQLENDR
ncbi:MAG: hypothetical protein AB8B55_19775 [Mariniblastus sp.]